jgi:TonB family protein
LDSVAQFIEVPAGVKSLANGLKFERKEEWINLSLNYSVDALQIIRDWSLYPVAASGPDASADKPKLPSEPNLVNPFPLFAEKPQYTVEARKSRAEGMVVIRGIVRRNGLVTDLKILTGLGSGLDESAMEVIKTKWRFIPGTFNGKPVDVMTDIQVRFFLY